ncbi:hypothetical protein AWW66_03320 [Micromonospora rosaria]|uniref:Uncharacterized protein n=1 Tax=Micromonospora rosaria TaxID=47874 RepID=A0A136PYC8_9ACTN|nr:hypothetical protein [Micromonospora rosaria]KXK63357.1 hypothetical protein AWW66_03320 [Micromonospora rosaria]
MLDVGDTARLTWDVGSSPATFDARVRLPDGTQTTLTTTEEPPGRYTAEYVVAQHGRHLVSAVATGPAWADVDVFNAAPPDWPAIVGLAEAKKHLDIPLDDHSDDDELRGFILSASMVVEDVVGVVARRTVTETASGGGRNIVLEKPPVLEVVDVRVDGVLVDPAVYRWSPSGLLTHQGGWPGGLRSVEITYLAGKLVVPPNIVNATLELLRINWRPQEGGNYAPFDGGGGDDFGNAGLEASLQGNLRLGFFVPNTVIQRLQPDQRGPVVL